VAAVTHTKGFVRQRGGLYPEMKWGFKDPQNLVWLERGEIWKFGTTKNPTTRYSGSFLERTGEGLFYKTEFSSPSTFQSLRLEAMKILNYKFQYLNLPPGNKMIK